MTCLITFFVTGEKTKPFEMDRGVIKNFLKICESLLGSDRELEVDITSGYRTKRQMKNCGRIVQEWQKTRCI